MVGLEVSSRHQALASAGGLAHELSTRQVCPMAPMVGVSTWVGVRVRAKGGIRDGVRERGKG